jgi:hypothetical protein
VVLELLRKDYENKKILVSKHTNIVKSFHRVINGVSVEKSNSNL